MMPYRLPGAPPRPSLLSPGRARTLLANPLDRRRRARRWRQGLPAFALYLAREIRSGSTVEQALITVIDQSPAPRRVVGVDRQLRAGRALADVLDEWSTTAAGSDEELLVAALSVGQQTGAPMARALESVATALRDDRELDDRRRVWLAQAQMSAGVLVLLPVLFASLSSALQGRFVYGSSAGLIALVFGLLLDGLGVLWIRRLLRGLR